MKRLVLIAHDIRSSHNVGSLLRTADGLGVHRVYLTGISPYPAKNEDERLPHIRARVDRQISKTALGAERSVGWDFREDLPPLITELKNDGFIVLALEQTPGAIDLREYEPAGDTALIVGNEVEGLSDEITELCHKALMIPMAGGKESFNVAVAAAIALYHLKYG